MIGLDTRNRTRIAMGGRDLWREVEVIIEDRVGSAGRQRQGFSAFIDGIEVEPGG